MVAAYLEVAELQALSQTPMYMKDWVERLDDFLKMTGKEILQHAGAISHQEAIDKARLSMNIQRIYTSAIGLALTIPSLLLLGFGDSVINVVTAGLCFGIGFGMLYANNMPILCQFVSSKHRATAYGIMNMVGVFSGAFITDFLGKSADDGSLGKDFAVLGAIVLVAVIVQLIFLRPKMNDFVDA